MTRTIPIRAENWRPAVAKTAGSHSLFTTLPPLSLYIHVPWCIRKCPYCDFNSHEASGDIPEDRYLDALQADIEQALPNVWGRQVHTVFIGGGTPSLLSASAVDRLMAMLRAHFNLWPDAEVTLEANPGAAEAGRFKSYAQSGVNRISLGIQTFNDIQLKKLGRVHDGLQARQAIEMAMSAVSRVNLDLMFALPGQSLQDSMDDARKALSFGTEHLSIYQLTLEPNTVFAKFPPELPDEDVAVQMEEGIEALLAEHDFERYEVSAFARPGARARHNVNYWKFGDYLGLGPGAHGKVSAPDGIRREIRLRNPESWMQASLLRNGSHISDVRQVERSDFAFEFMLNALRLKEGVPLELFFERTGLEYSDISTKLALAKQKKLLTEDPSRLQATDAGWRFLNELQTIFL
ncbi:radical SAM family heme chaperone HemW [Zwartia sp.]|uniref:radical SAM family heme chaperone HemW n=1 Tax=Zwartia sp. TaxID=2978004 RepID=UPI003BB19244